MSPEITSDEALEVYRSVCHRTGAFETASNISRFLARVVEIQALQELGLHAVSPPPVNLEEKKWGPLPEEFRSSPPQQSYTVRPTLDGDLYVSFKTSLSKEELYRLNWFLNSEMRTFQDFIDETFTNFLRRHTPFGGRSSTDVREAGGDPPSDVAKKL